jgi:hypothetical protein
MYIATSKAASECLEPSTATRMFSNISTHKVILCIEKVFYETIVLVALIQTLLLYQLPQSARTSSFLMEYKRIRAIVVGPIAIGVGGFIKN